jgi:tripartite-type tricarboxylate transporter receptor subunit TctC
LAALPDLPTVAETISSFDAGTWFAIGAPRGTSPEIIERLNREISAGLAQPSIRIRFAELGTTPMVMTPAELGRLTASDADKWAKVVKSAGVKAE